MCTDTITNQGKLNTSSLVLTTVGSVCRASAEDTIERDVRKVLDGCIRSLEPKRGRGRARASDDGPVLKIMDRMLHKV